MTNNRKRRRRNPLTFYSVTDIANKYHFHRNTIRAWIHRDGLRYYRRGPHGNIYIRADDLREFLGKYYDMWEYEE